jgi:hypothetical protein
MSIVGYVARKNGEREHGFSSAVTSVLNGKFKPIGACNRSTGAHLPRCFHGAELAPVPERTSAVAV